MEKRITEDAVKTHVLAYLGCNADASHLEGIHVLSVDCKTGGMAKVESYAVPHAVYLCMSSDGSILYSCSDTGIGSFFVTGIQDNSCRGGTAPSCLPFKRTPSIPRLGTREHRIVALVVPRRRFPYPRHHLDDFHSCELYHIAVHCVNAAPETGRKSLLELAVSHRKSRLRKMMQKLLLRMCEMMQFLLLYIY